MEDVLLTERCGSIATLTLNRPDALNVLDERMIEALVACTSRLASDQEVRVVRLRGAGKHFMAGGDIRLFSGQLQREPQDRRRYFERTIARVHAAIETFARMPQPIVCQVQGAVAGFGLSLMNACDLVIAAEDAYFASAYRQLAVSPDGGGSYSLPRIVGVRAAMEILLLGERFDARRALALGLVNRVVAAADVEPTAAAMAQSLAEAPAMAVRNTRRLVRESLSRTLSEQLAAEAASFAQCAATEDFAEAVEAFLAKRPPRFAR